MTSRLSIFLVFTLAVSQALAACPNNCNDCDTNNTKCMGCQSGYWLDNASGNCTACPSNCLECLSATMCTFCQKGFFPVYDQNQISCQSSCPSGPNTTCCKEIGFYLKFSDSFTNFTNFNSPAISNNASIAINNSLNTHASLANSGRMTIQGGLFTYGTLANSGNLYVSRAITTEDTLSNSGAIISTDSINSTQSLSNSGNLSTNGSVITGNGSIRNSGNLIAGGNVSSGGDVSNSGQINATTVVVNGSLANSGGIAATSVTVNGSTVPGVTSGSPVGSVAGIPSNQDPVLTDKMGWNFGCVDNSQSGQNVGNGDMKLGLSVLAGLSILGLIVV